MKIKFMIMSLAALAVLAGCKKENPEMPSSYAVYGKIYTAVVNPEAKSDDDRYQMAEALVVKKGKYVFVGSKEDAKQYITSNMLVIDHTDKGLIMPGMTDGHAHYIMQHSLPMFAENTIKFANTDSYDDVLAKVRAKVEAAEKAGKTLKFIYGEGYDYMFWTKQRDYKDLDAISKTIPMFLASFDQHSCWCNSATMINAGILDAEGRVIRSEIPGGIVGMDDLGNIQGVFYERATSLLVTKGLKYMHLTNEQAVNAVKDAQKYLHSVGITNVLCGWSTYYGNEDETFYHGLAALDGDNKLYLNYALAYEIEPFFDEPLSYVGKAADFKKKYEKYPHILPNYIKLFADGTVEGGTGWLYDYPYKHIPQSPVPGAFEGNGMPLWTEAQLKAFASEANAKGIALHVHAMGDGAVHYTCEAIKAGGSRSVRNALCHLRNVSANDFATIRDNNIAVAAALNWHCLPMANRETIKQLLPEYYATHSYPVKSYFDNGILVSSATDTPAHDGVNYPFHIMQVAVTGVGDDSPAWCPEENATRQQALQALTYNGAWQLGLEKERGSIEVGKYADFILVDQDVLTCPVSEIINTKVVNTFFEGKKVYGK